MAVLLGGGGVATAGPREGGSCPGGLPRAGSPDPAAASRLVPAGATGVLLCRYHFRRLEGSGLITSQARTSTLTRLLDALRPMPPGTYSCPADLGVVVAARFAYPSVGPDTVQVQETGCALVTNGHLVRWAAYPPGAALERALLADTGCRGRRNQPACA